MKRIIALCLCVCLCLAAGTVSVLAESTPSFTVQNTPVTDGNSEISSMDLRFYADTPNIAYIGFKAYMDEMFDFDTTVTAQEDGTWVIAIPNGKTVVANPSAGTLYAEDWAGFQTPEPPYIRKKAGIKDTDSEWTEVRDIIYDDEPTPVTFDFAKYGIAMYADEEDVCLPLTVVSALLENPSMNSIAYNGEKLFRFDGTNGDLVTFVPGYFDGETIKARLNGEVQREEDQIRESYAELCFFADYLYGYPGVAALEGALREKGLDEALNDLPDDWGERIRERLHSSDYIEYLAGLYDLFSVGLSDGHTQFTTCGTMMMMADSYSDGYQRLTPMILDSMMYAMETYQNFYKPSLIETRQELWGDDFYREYGSTGIIRIDMFGPDYAGWLAWEEGKGEMPMDALGITYSGLEKAAANPAIKNIIFDLSANGGGSQDLTMAIIGMVTGDVLFSGYNELTKQRIHADVITDRNMDGVIDDKDKDVTYDYNFGVLTSRFAFSCGNLFPILMQEKGAAVIGENTGGGDCVVNLLALPDGPFIQLSSYQWHLRNSEGEDVVEKGADPDIPIDRIENTDAVNPYFPRLTPGDYTPYFNDEMLDQLMNEYFEEKEELAA